MECFFKTEFSNRRVECPIYNLTDCRIKNYPPSCSVLKVERRYTCSRWTCFSATTTTTASLAATTSTTTGTTATAATSTVSTTAISSTMSTTSLLENVVTEAVEFWNDQALNVRIAIGVSVTVLILLILFGCSLKLWFVRKRRQLEIQKRNADWEAERRRTAGFFESTMSTTNAMTNATTNAGNQGSDRSGASGQNESRPGPSSLMVRASSGLAAPDTSAPGPSRAAAHAIQEGGRGASMTSKTRASSIPLNGSTLTSPPTQRFRGGSAPPIPPRPYTSSNANFSRRLGFDLVQQPCSSKMAFAMDQDPLIQAGLRWGQERSAKDPLKQAENDWDQGKEVVLPPLAKDVVDDQLPHAVPTQFPVASLPDPIGLGPVQPVQLDVGVDNVQPVGGAAQIADHDQAQLQLNDHAAVGQNQGLLRRLSRSSTSSYGSASSSSSYASYGSAISHQVPQTKRGRPAGALNRSLEERLFDSTKSFEGPLPRRSPRKLQKDQGFYADYDV